MATARSPLWMVCPPAGPGSSPAGTPSGPSRDPCWQPVALAGGWCRGDVVWPVRASAGSASAGFASGGFASGGLAGGGPVSARLLPEGGDGGFDRREEVLRVDRAGEPVTLDLAPDRVLELGEHQAYALVVQRLVELLQHVGCGGVHVSHRLGGDQDPDRRRVGPGHAPDLVAERRG